MTVFSRQLKMNMTNRNPYRSGACGSIRASLNEQQNAPDGRNPRNVTMTETEFSKSDGIMNTKTNTSLWYKSLAVLALSCALANTALGQVSRIDWGGDDRRLPSITYGTALGPDQFNARALDSQGERVEGGAFTYYWQPEGVALPAEQESWVANCSRISPTTVAYNGLGFNPVTDSREYSCDHDDNSATPNKTGTYDWLYLDVGTHTIRATYRIGSGNRSWSRDVTITVTKAPLTVSPRPVSTRAYGDENFKGYESDLNPTWPSGKDLFVQDGDDAELVTQGGSQFRKLRQDNDSNDPILDVKGADPIMIPVIPENDPTHYTRTGVDVQFVGFVRGETYQNLVKNDPSIATTEERNNDPLVPRRFKLRVRKFENNDPSKNPTNDILFRSAPVGTRGFIDFNVLPQFKNYEVSEGQTAATLTVTKAKIEIKAETNLPKTYGETINPRLPSDTDTPDPDLQNSQYTGATPNDSRLNSALIKTPTGVSSPFAWGNNFRFGEGFIERLVVADSAGWAADAAVGKPGITLVQNHGILSDTAFLNSYEITLANGNLEIKKRKYKLLVEDASQSYGDILPP